MNNVMWMGIPIITVIHPSLQQPAACQGFLFLLTVNRFVMFATIVFIAIFRYLAVVENHSYPPNKSNVTVFVTATIIVGITKWITRVLSGDLRCLDEAAWTPDNFVVLKRPESAIKLVPIGLALRMLEYSSGVPTSIFCYTRILRKTIRSDRERVQRVRETFIQTPEHQAKQPSSNCNDAKRNLWFMVRPKTGDMPVRP